LNYPFPSPFDAIQELKEISGCLSDRGVFKLFIPEAASFAAIIIKRTLRIDPRVFAQLTNEGRKPWIAS
jgi:hypothetical protein